jgi:hypothetical protein
MQAGKNYKVMEALSSSETSVVTRATRHNIPEDASLQTRNLYRYGIQAYMTMMPKGHQGTGASLAPEDRKE